MEQLVYLNRWQWAHRFQMEANSRPARSWLSERHHAVVVPDRGRLASDQDNDRVAMDFISASNTRIQVLEYSELRHLAPPPDLPFVFVHPYSDDEQQATRDFLTDHRTVPALVMVWREQDLIRLWLESRAATNLLASESTASADPVALRAARTMVSEEYNGLASGRGKDTVIHALRALRDAGYSLDPDFWARAILAADGSFESARTVAQFAREITAGRRHRVAKERFRPNIVSIWRDMVEQEARTTT
ncbi:hypothetical protein [Cellulomonas pakistanensis]|uniref:DUF4123 domain-containing protein n=1 Tax=Cellulomonas pakistanensis TaxID=992287 RepID=A0A919P5P2_9CELL|nr:hypothetical protein [Cellulomonas pakistanensis]GIG34740.1 hypothetical protein Cpa01nite_01210 [Cellulomonas pakistanensis]